MKAWIFLLSIYIGDWTTRLALFIIIIIIIIVAVVTDIVIVALIVNVILNCGQFWL